MSTLVVRNTLSQVLRYFKGDSSQSILPFVSRPVRFFLLLLLIFNYRSLPLTWHIRIFYPGEVMRLRWLLLKNFSSRKAQNAWLGSISPVGKSPFAITSSYFDVASPDDCDFNMHLSNSSYAKTMDMARHGFLLRATPLQWSDGGWVALGATNYHFVREIPLGAGYEIRTRLGSWDGKWVYLISKFVTKSKSIPSSKSQSHRPDLLSIAKDILPATGEHTTNLDGTPGSSTPNPVPGAPRPSVTGLKDDETLHCTVVSQMCFKLGRLTVPPALVIAAAGFGVSPTKWTEILALRAVDRSPKPKSNVKTGEASAGMRTLLKGGWRDVPEGERWWEMAVAPFENERVRRLEVVAPLREGLEGARAL